MPESETDTSVATLDELLEEYARAEDPQRLQVLERKISFMRRITPST